MTYPVLRPLPAGEQTHPLAHVPVQSDAVVQQGEVQPVFDEEEEGGTEHPVVELEQTLLPWLSTLIQHRPSSSCSGVLPSEQAQPLPTTLQQGVDGELTAAADADADAETVFTGQSFAVGCTL